MNGTRQGNHTEGVRTMTRFNTQLVHGLPVNDNNTGAVNPPIYNSSTYAFESVGTMPRWDYARSGNPTREFLEKQIAQLEHGTRGFAFGSGLAAIHAVLSIFQPGDRIIVGKNIYGGTYSLFHEYFERWGVIVEEVDTTDYKALDAAVSGESAKGNAHGCPAKAVYFEVLTNPLLQVNNVTAIAGIAHRHGAIAIVDNTFVTPYLQQPLDQGADIVIHSATKYLAGHSEVNAGLVVVKDDELGKRVYFAQNRLGGVLAPNECDSVRRGIQTLALRMDRQQENARAISSYLLLHPLVKSVHYPGLPGHEYELASNGLKGGGAVLSFEVVPGVDPADVLDNLHIFRLAVSSRRGGIACRTAMPHDAFRTAARGASKGRHHRRAGASRGRHRRQAGPHRGSRPGLRHRVRELSQAPRRRESVHLRATRICLKVLPSVGI